MAVNPESVTQTSRLLVIGAMVLAVLAQGFYLWAASLMFWVGPGQSPTLDEGLLIARMTSVVLLAAAVLVVAITRATALGVTMGVGALLLLINFDLWLVVGAPVAVAVLTLGSVWLVRSRRRPQPTRRFRVEGPTPTWAGD